MDNPTPTPQPASSAPTFVWVAVLFGVAILAVQAFLIFVVLDTRSEVASLGENVGDVELRLATGPSEPAATTQPALAATSTTPTTSTDATEPAVDTPSTIPALPSSPAPELTTDAEGLPVFDAGLAEDPAVGVQLGTLGAVEWAAGDELVVDLADGTARAIMVWAHWCPECQQQLTDLATWYDADAASLANTEVVTISSAPDPESETPLPAYLSEQEFPFPVLLDSDDEIAARLGVNAFPFWVFVSPEGRVIGRIPGQLPTDQFADLFTQLDAIAAS